MKFKICLSSILTTLLHLQILHSMVATASLASAESINTEAAFTDCQVSCSFPTVYTVRPSTPTIAIILPRVFTMTFQYQVSSSPSSSSLANIFDIYSYGLGRSLLSVSLEVGSNQMHVNYNGTNVIPYGPGVTFSSSQSTTFTLTVSSKLITLGNGVYSLANMIPGVLSGSNCIVYISTNAASPPMVSAGGVVKNIAFVGKRETT